MFSGLTYFGIPLEFFLRIGEVSTIIMLIIIIILFFFYKKDNREKHD